ncbi:thermonuclease family protein [Haematobacter genomosp. 1]|uniref:TNase-like domain-containing protein n=1 Tax=Haematobacter genomosp. 1 TaxID=366618 RepID=A0A212AEM5_9RHOB|nr:hypothetical protein CDV49_03515 [Haematobacter genomosp. 1]
MRARRQGRRCGTEAANALAALIARSPVTCVERDVDQYGRVVAVCAVRGIDVNRWMVANGWAVGLAQGTETIGSLPLPQWQCTSPRFLSIWQHLPGGDDFLHPPPWAETGVKTPMAKTSANAHAKTDRINSVPHMSRGT